MAILLVLPLLSAQPCAAGDPPGGGGGSPRPTGEAATGPSPPTSGPPADEATAHRDALVAHLSRELPGVDPAVLDAMRRVPRHAFMPGTTLEDAYADRAFPIGYGQTISQPTVVAIMTDALRLRGGERVLEIGTGSGYQAAVLDEIGARVWSIEIVEPLGEEARRRLRAFGHDRVEVRIGDGYRGWPEQAPFDRILLTAAPPELPPDLVRQLADGGVLVAPVGSGGDQELARWTRRDGRLEREALGAVRFVPMVTATPVTD